MTAKIIDNALPCSFLLRMSSITSASGQSLARGRYRKRGKKPPVFIWVAENPNDSNPHVHILTNDKIEYRHFRMWARGLERLWKNGTVHLEKMKYAKAAGRYLMKAVGYLAKGANGNQGSVAGQRYGVSRDLMPREYIDYVYAGIEGIIAYRKMIAEPCGKKFNAIYLHEYGIWAPPGFGMDQLLAWLFDHLPEPLQAQPQHNTA